MRTKTEILKKKKQTNKQRLKERKEGRKEERKKQRKKQRKKERKKQRKKETKKERKKERKKAWFNKTCFVSYYTRKGPTKPQNRLRSLTTPPFLNLQRWCLYCIPYPAVKSDSEIQTSRYLFCLDMLTLVS